MEIISIGKEVKTLSPALLQKMNAYWRAANYLSVGQIYHAEQIGGYLNLLKNVKARLPHVGPFLFPFLLICVNHKTYP